MKNYYRVLNVRDFASMSEVSEAYYNGDINDTDRIEAFRALVDNKKEYDVSLSKHLKLTNKKNFDKRLVVFPLVAAMLTGGITWSLTRHFGKENTEDLTDSTSKSATIENNAEQKQLTADNFDATVDLIYNDSKSKGLNIDKTFIKSALFVTNIDYLSEENIKLLYGSVDLNMIEEIQNAYNYFSEVRTHNNNGKTYISFTNLVYDEEDKNIINALDNEMINLKNSILSMTSDEYQTSFNRMSAFYTGQGQLVGSDGELYSNNSLTSGAGLLSEAYWPEFAVTYMTSDLQTKENSIDIKTLSEDVINGSKYLGAIINHESLNCLTNTNGTLTK